MEAGLFDYHLPERLIAQTPLADRCSSRLMTLCKHTGEIRHCFFADLERLLKAGDTLVLNDTKVIPARLFGVKKQTGAKVEILLLKDLGNDRWEALVKPGKRLQTGSVIHFGHVEPGDGGSPLTATIEQTLEEGGRVIRFAYRGIFNEILDQLGSMPLPPYIKSRLEDRDRYQTVYAKEAGSAAAPTAGLHFTENMLNRLRDRGVNIAFITLHVGLGTFRPVIAENIEEHAMHAEYYMFSPETANLLNRSREEGKRIIAVGTTSARTLETVAARIQDGRLIPSSGWTNIFIYPGYKYKLVDALITNFHLPKSTLLMLVSALAGRENVLKAYYEAIEREYRFFSFGDAMFIY